ncbi:uncharacterized protein LOC127732834 isoform X2 [Mytilus californianus]|uniref:uncharacterized protein LOC127732834 isoform X2 n=1 Tax=Mytilus californianus TaxID=6549 RepID=UPI0022481345|nr:uncharacterized protein LOC127732834 isoform X2 [Mytilus californianus]
MTVTKIKKYIPGEDVILECNVNITSNHTISWFFETKVIWTGDKLNEMSNNSLRYEITEKINLRIKNTSIHDEGIYTCLPVPPMNNGKYTVTLESEPFREKNSSNSSHSSKSNETTDQILNAEVKTNLNEEKNNVKNQNIHLYVFVYIACCCGCSLMFCAGGFIVQKMNRVKEKETNKKKVNVVGKCKDIHKHKRMNN